MKQVRELVLPFAVQRALSTMRSHLGRELGLAMDELDIWRAAQLLIRQRDDPGLFATQRVDDMIEAGDVRGEAVWKQILSAIRKLRTTIPDGADVN